MARLPGRDRHGHISGLEQIKRGDVGSNDAHPPTARSDVVKRKAPLRVGHRDTMLTIDLQFNQRVGDTTGWRCGRCIVAE